MTKKVLIYTDSRGQHTPRGAPVHEVFAERLANHPDIDAEIVLCPMKWTTTLDFLEYIKGRDPSHWDHIILFTGIVEWSPRPQPSAINDLYSNASPANLTNTSLNTRDYSRKVVNNKKPAFDTLFGEAEITAYLSIDLGVEYEGQPTVNMYGLDMARDQLIPLLKQIPNLIFINSNRFIPGWEGDFARGRPANIRVTEAYSELFRNELGADRVIDLLQWDERRITEFTCDNLHLTQAGSDWIYDQLAVALKLSPNPVVAPRAASVIAVDRGGDRKHLKDFSKALGEFEVVTRFYESRNKTNYVKAGIPEFHADYKYISTMSFLLGEKEIGIIAESNSKVRSNIEMQAIAQRLYASEFDAASYIAKSSNAYMARWRAEYQALTLGKNTVFPYNYFSAYSFNYLDSNTKAQSISIDFIYCIKNRKTRTALSIESLIRSIEAYQRKGALSGLSVSITVVEDLSDDIFDPNNVRTYEDIRHFVVETGVKWTRSGLLNVGIRNSEADIVALVDADFLFHEGYIFSLDNFLRGCDWKRHVIANNLIETEAHYKNDIVFSAHSPYSYMWMAPREALVKVKGFDEGYTGHGSEDRDLELKLVKLAGLTVTDTASIEPECFVLHLSHTSRDGFEKHQENRSRYLQRLEGPVEGLRQENWGEQDVVWAAQSSDRQPAANTALTLDRSFAPRRYSTRPIRFDAQKPSVKRTLYVVISCVAYADRQALLDKYYRTCLDGDAFVFVVGGSDQNRYDPVTRTLHLAVGDFYEDLPEKVLAAIAFCSANFDFEHLVKIDDDVIANFGLLQQIIDEFGADYFGKMIPSKRGAKPSPNWHIGKVSERSPFFDKPFYFDSGPSHWCCGGMYAMTRYAAKTLSEVYEKIEVQDYLYEDHMVGSLLDKAGVQAKFIEEHQTLSGFRFIQTDLRELMGEELQKFNNDELLSSVGGIHCGPFPPLYPVSRERALEMMADLIERFGLMQSGGVK